MGGMGAETLCSLYALLAPKGLIYETYIYILFVSYLVLYLGEQWGTDNLQGKGGGARIRKWGRGLGLRTFQLFLAVSLTVSSYH